MYDEMKRNEDNNPTLGIILCSDTDEDIAKYSILHGHEQLFASKYRDFVVEESVKGINPLTGGSGKGLL